MKPGNSPPEVLYLNLKALVSENGLNFRWQDRMFIRRVMPSQHLTSDYWIPEVGFATEVSSSWFQHARNLFY